MAEVKEVPVPDIGDFTDVPVIEVLVSVGDTVAEDDPLITLESDKATMEIPSPSAGKVEAIKVSIGDKVSQGDLILTLATGDGASSDGGAPTTDKGAESEPAGEEEPEEEEPAPRAPETPASRADEEDAPPPDTEAPAPPEPKPSPESAAVYASPSVRRLAREKGVDLSQVTGSGRKGRITKEDVERAAREGGGPAAPSAAEVPAGAVAGLDLAPWPRVDFEKFGPVERVERTRIQKISAPNLARNWVMIPHVTHHDEADITDLEAFRKQVNAEQSDVKVTMVALLVKACVATLKAFPDFNASLDGEGLVRKHYWHIGFAADTPQGLVVPVIRDADKKGLLEIAASLSDLSGKARAGKLGLGDMQGGTFTISSLGGIGGTGFTPIVNAPEVAILGVTRSAMKPVWNGSEFIARLMVPLSLSYDHRVIDGAAAARFTAHLVGVLQDMRRVIL